MNEWRHSGTNRGWELGFVAYDTWRMLAFVGDGLLIGRNPAFLRELAVGLDRRLGTVPPPLAVHLPVRLKVRMLSTTEMSARPPKTVPKPPKATESRSKLR